MTPVARNKRVGTSTKQAIPMSQGPEPKQSCQGRCEGGLQVIDALLDISSQLQTTEAYITYQQKTERVHHMRGTTQPTGPEGSRRSSYLPTTSPTQDAVTNVLEAVQERVMKHLRKVHILDMTTTVEESRSNDAAREP